MTPIKQTHPETMREWALLGAVAAIPFLGAPIGGSQSPATSTGTQMDAGNPPSTSGPIPQATNTSPARSRKPPQGHPSQLLHPRDIAEADRHLVPTRCCLERFRPIVPGRAFSPRTRGPGRCCRQPFDTPCPSTSTPMQEAGCTGPLLPLRPVGPRSRCRHVRRGHP